jgi:hypothetical protein
LRGSGFVTECRELGAGSFLVYAPRHDIAVGPFNSLWNLDIGSDNAKSMQTHAFTKRLLKDMPWLKASIKKGWNSFSRCYLAIEIDFNGTSKHMLGSMVNAIASGSIGIVIVNKDCLEKAKRISNYLRRLEELGRLETNDLRNLIIYEEQEFLELLSQFISQPRK